MENGEVRFATFSAVAVSAAQDVFEIVAPANARISIHEVRLGQYSDAADAQAEMLSVLMIRGYTTTGSGGAAVTPTTPTGGLTSGGATVARNNTGVAANGTPATVVADSFNVMAGWLYRPPAAERILLQPNERLVVRITAPADAVTMNGTLVFSHQLLKQ